MPQAAFEEHLNRLLAGRGYHYPADAYRFIYAVVIETVERLGAKGHVTAIDVLEGFRIKCNKEFGIWGESVLEAWDIGCAAAVGRAVFELVGVGALAAQKSDTIQDFDIPDVRLCDPAPPTLSVESVKWKGETID